MGQTPADRHADDGTGKREKKCGITEESFRPWRNILNFTFCFFFFHFRAEIVWIRSRCCRRFLPGPHGGKHTRTHTVQPDSARARAGACVRSSFPLSPFVVKFDVFPTEFCSAQDTSFLTCECESVRGCASTCACSACRSVALTLEIIHKHLSLYLCGACVGGTPLQQCGWRLGVCVCFVSVYVRVRAADQRGWIYLL